MMDDIERRLQAVEEGLRYWKISAAVLGIALAYLIWTGFRPGDVTARQLRVVDARGNRCLLGHAEDWVYAGSLFRNRAGDLQLQRWRVQHFGPSSHLEIGRRFDGRDQAAMPERSISSAVIRLL
jgi:hypothetical protein